MEWHAQRGRDRCLHGKGREGLVGGVWSGGGLTYEEEEEEVFPLGWRS